MFIEDSYFEEIRNSEFSRLDDTQQVYLDFTGGNLYPESLIKNHSKVLLENVFGNPHSTNPASQQSTVWVKNVRKKVIEFFNAEDYYCVFTQNATHALKIVGESYPFTEKSYFLMLADNHNSVNGIREFAMRKSAGFSYLPINFSDLKINEFELKEVLSAHQNSDSKLFAYPAQSNVSGVKHSLEWIKEAQENGWDVLLDAAAFVPTNTLDLKLYQPDFVTLSFYKMFGYPTGVGALLIKKSKFHKLQKPWFAGGTVKMVSVKNPKYFLVDNHERFEDGTIDYTNLPAIKMGLCFLEDVGLSRIQKRIYELRKYAYEELSSLKHSNGKPLVNLFGPTNHENVGGTLIMTFFNKNGEKYLFEEIERKANAKNISIRSGCFCNPGIDEITNEISEEELANYYKHTDDADFQSMVNFLGKMRGAIRVSFGIATLKKDIDYFITFLKDLIDQ